MAVVLQTETIDVTLLLFLCFILYFAFFPCPQTTSLSEFSPLTTDGIKWTVLQLCPTAYWLVYHMAVNRLYWYFGFISYWFCQFFPFSWSGSFLFEEWMQLVQLLKAWFSYLWFSQWLYLPRLLPISNLSLVFERSILSSGRSMVWSQYCLWTSESKQINSIMDLSQQSGLRYTPDLHCSNTWSLIKE